MAPSLSFATISDSLLPPRNKKRRAEYPDNVFEMTFDSKYDIAILKQDFVDLTDDYLHGKHTSWPYCSDLHNVLKNVGFDHAFCNRNEF